MTLTPAQQAAAKQTRTVVHGAGEPTHAVIWLHGLGASSDDFPPVIPYLGLSDSRTIRFVFPQAPERPITINGGMVMPGWYDIKGMDLVDKEDLEGMSESSATLERLIQEQVDKGVPTSNIVIAGFSQGERLLITPVYATRKNWLGLWRYLPICLSPVLQRVSTQV